jgi:hypothetical protein
MRDEARQHRGHHLVARVAQKARDADAADAARQPAGFGRSCRGFFDRAGYAR